MVKDITNESISQSIILNYKCTSLSFSSTRTGHWLLKFHPFPVLHDHTPRPATLIVIKQIEELLPGQSHWKVRVLLNDERGRQDLIGKVSKRVILQGRGCHHSRERRQTAVTAARVPVPCLDMFLLLCQRLEHLAHWEYRSCTLLVLCNQVGPQSSTQTLALHQVLLVLVLCQVLLRVAHQSSEVTQTVQASRFIGHGWWVVVDVCWTVSGSTPVLVCRWATNEESGADL